MFIYEGDGNLLCSERPQARRCLTACCETRAGGDCSAPSQAEALAFRGEARRGARPCRGLWRARGAPRAGAGGGGAAGPVRGAPAAPSCAGPGAPARREAAAGGCSSWGECGGGAGAARPGVSVAAGPGAARPGMSVAAGPGLLISGWV